MKFYKRTQTRKINIGSVTVGGGFPIAIQSMTNTNSRDWKSTVRQIRQLEEVGCEIVRISLPDMESAYNVSKIKKNIKIPLIADIHFDYKIALEAIKQGIDKLRINPGNIGSKDKIRILVKEVKKARIPIRIGVNAGSLEGIYNFSDNSLRAKFLLNAAISHIRILEEYDFQDIIVSLKASDIDITIQACKIFASKNNYPLHLGITESGSVFSGTIKSVAGLSIMLHYGIGDTVRISLTSDPVEEVRVAYSLLQSMKLRSSDIEIISCPTCSRCKINLVKIVSDVEKRTFLMKKLKKFSKPIKIALMGCIVNGLGEVKDVNLGIVGSENMGILFKNGKIVDRVNQDKLVQRLVSMIENYQE